MRLASWAASASASARCASAWARSASIAGFVEQALVFYSDGDLIGDGLDETLVLLAEGLRAFAVTGQHAEPALPGAYRQDQQAAARIFLAKIGLQFLFPGQDFVRIRCAATSGRYTAPSASAVSRP
jgi:hypothetical protein